MKMRDEQVTQTIGLRLQTKRKQANKTVDDVQNETGITRSSIRNYEAGLRQPPLGVIRKLASVLNCSAAYLAGLSDKEGDSASLAFIPADPYLAGKKTTMNDSVAFNAEFLASKRLSPAKIALVTANDNLMEPNIQKGADVLIDTSNSSVTEPDIYAIKDKHGNIFFRWARRNIGTEEIVIYATNDVHFPKITISGRESDSVTIFGKVVCVVNWR